MPYNELEDLPETVRSVLPTPAFVGQSMRCGVAWSTPIWAGVCSRNAWRCR